MARPWFDHDARRPGTTGRRVRAGATDSTSTAVGGAEIEVPLWVGALVLASLAALAGLVPLVVTTLLIARVAARRAGWSLGGDGTSDDAGGSPPLGRVL